MLAAALALLDEHGTDSPTTDQIAQQAEVSVATVYNLVGTREQLLMALVDRLIGDLAGVPRDGARDEDPIGALRELVAGSVDLLTSRSNAYRKVFLQLASIANPDLHTQLSPATVFAEAMRRAQDTGVLRDDLDADALAFQVYLSFNGALLRWAVGALADEEFKAAALHGLSLVLAAGATERIRGALLDDLRRSGRRR